MEMTYRSKLQTLIIRLSGSTSKSTASTRRLSKQSYHSITHEVRTATKYRLTWRSTIHCSYSRPPARSSRDSNTRAVALPGTKIVLALSWLILTPTVMMPTHVRVWLASPAGLGFQSVKLVRVWSVTSRTTADYIYIYIYIRAWLPSQAPRGGLASQILTCMGTATQQSRLYCFSPYILRPFPETLSTSSSTLYTSISTLIVCLLHTVLGSVPDCSQFRCILYTEQLHTQYMLSYCLHCTLSSYTLIVSSRPSLYMLCTVHQ
jgi:hypothetical protein